MFFWPKSFGSEKYVQKNFVFKKCFVFKKLLCPKNFCVQQILGQITNMDKCCKDTSCLDNDHPDCWHLIVLGTYLWNLVKIKTVWTNVTRTNVARTNVTVTVGICPRCTQEPKFKGESYLAEQFRQITHYSAEQFRQIAHYLAEHLIQKNDILFNE